MTLIDKFPMLMNLMNVSLPFALNLLTIPVRVMAADDLTLILLKSEVMMIVAGAQYSMIEEKI